MANVDALLPTAAALRAAWKAGRPVFGIWAALPDGFAAELMALDGVDYICVDQQHGLIGYETFVEMTRAIEARGVVPVTRVPANESWLIAKALDAGSQGVVVPLVNNRREAEAAVAACRYPPAGTRSFGPIRATVTMRARDAQTLGSTVLCLVMIETAEGVRNVEEIASTPGLDGIYIGPADLALGLGLPPDLDKDEPEHVAAVEAIRAACERHGVVAGIQCGSGASAASYARQGFRFVTFAKDSALLQVAVRREIAVARGEEKNGAVARVGYT
jgi:4-hydroxy-2-oxoheptanedioate aldolase